MEDFIRVKPTLWFLPRLWETIYQRLRERVDKTEALNRELFDLSYDIKKELHSANNIIQHTLTGYRKWIPFFLSCFREELFLT